MKKVLAKILILFFIFAAGVTATALLLNSQSTDDRSDLNEATLPEVMIDMNGTLVNRMYGYAQPMQRQCDSAGYLENTFFCHQSL